MDLSCFYLMQWTLDVAILPCVVHMNVTVSPQLINLFMARILIFSYIHILYCKFVVCAYILN